MLIRRRRKHHVEQPRAILREFGLGHVHQGEEAADVSVRARGQHDSSTYRPSDTYRSATTLLLLWIPLLDRLRTRRVKRRRTRGYMLRAKDNRCCATRELTHPGRSCRHLARSLSKRTTMRLRCAAEDKTAPRQ